ncbi:MAG TPA: hypothetical protein VK897_09005 [Anaerolineales bacterium]|nr:hypothetical protein [Anaerolineales bacterium]
MNFLLRFLLVMAVVVGIGFALYYAVQALPGDSPQANQNQSAGGSLSQNNSSASENTTSRTERPQNNRNAGIRWRSITRIARRTFMFAIIVLMTVLAKGVVFGRESNTKKSRR